jgi:peroxiredoxin Q/BCP
VSKIGIGDQAPDFELEGTGRIVSRLSALRGSWVVLAFYPGDFTPVCTRQFCSYRDAADRLDELDAVVLGISPQSVSSHDRFTAEHGLTVPLLADPEHATARAYGIVGAGGLVRRSIFIIDPDGIVRYRHVALLGLRYRDVQHLGAALTLARHAGAAA